MVCRAYLVACAPIIAILLAGGTWQMSGTRIVVQGNGQLVNNPLSGGALSFVVLIAALAVPVSWGPAAGSASATQWPTITLPR
jgi:hypothetical protein